MDQIDKNRALGLLIMLASSLASIIFITLIL
jgi:hypothetical protein